MAAVQLYAKKQGSEEYVALDLFQEEPIKLNFSVQNIEDPLAATSTFSRTFKVPNTSVNSPYFKAVFNVNSVDFDASKKADAYINDNNLYFTSGNIRLNAVYRGEKEDSVQYEITFYGETSDFGSKIGGGFLNELNFSDYNHNKSWDNVRSSWTNGLFNGDIVYGLIEWGYNYNANNQPIEPTLSNGFNNSFTLASKALLLEQWKPQFRAKAIWDQVFEESGYTYDSTFLDSVLFKKMYIISDNIAQATLDNSNTFEAYSNRFLATVLGAENTLEAEVEVSDPGNNWTPSTSRYRAPSTGTYTFKINYAINIDIYDPFNPAFEYLSEVTVVDDAGNYSLAYEYATITSEWDNVSLEITCNLNAGQVVRFDHHSQRISGPILSGATRIYIDQLAIKCTLAPNILSINGIMPSNIRKIDFMRSIINRFRLVFVPSREIKNHFTITPWKDWILEGKSIDWTNKLDTSKDLKITPLFYGQDRFQIYKDQEDGDFINYQYQLTYKQTVGQLNLDSTNELIKGTKTYQDSFAPTPVAPIGFKDGDVPGSRFVIPHIAKDVGSTDDTAGTTVITGKREPIQPKLRLVFYNGLIASPLTWYARKQNGGSGAYETLNTYPLMSSYSSWPVSSTTFDLNWENEAPFWDPLDTVLGNGQTAFSQFNTYWKTWYDVTFDPYSRIVEANLVLDYSDILDLKFNDYVFIKDTWYFVNNISDYITGQSTNCRVQLIKVGNIGITLPIVTDVRYTPVNLCTASTACFAFCCNVNVGGNPVSGTYYIDGLTLATASRMFSDQYGSIPAPTGFYSDGITTVQVTNGNIVQIIDTEDCDCGVTSYPFTVKFASTLCGQSGVCCNGITQTVYGANPTFELNSYLYYNSTLTLPVGAGWYKLLLGTDALKVQGLLGQVFEVGSCTTCPPCETYYPHTVCYANTEASQYYSCCCEDIQQVWTNNSLFNGSTEIYTDNSGSTPAPLGYYNKNGDIARVNVTAGVISSFANCANSDITCPTEPVEIEVSLTAEVPGYTSTATLYKSNNGISGWVAVGAVSIEPTDPANTTVLNTFTVQELAYTKCTFTTNTVAGTMTTEVVVNLTQVQEHANATPVSYTETLAGTVSSTNSYRYSGVIEGGEPTGDRLYVGGIYRFYQTIGWPFPGGSELGSIMALDLNADIIEDFNVDIAYQRTQIGPFTGIYELTAISGNRIACGGDQNLYKLAPITAGLSILNETGDLDTTFNTSIGVPNGRILAIAEDPSTGILYIGGIDFQYWDQGPLGGTSNPYTASPYMVALNGEDASTIAGFTALFDSDDFAYISKIRIYNGKIYVAGSFQTYDGEIKSGIVRLNMDGSLDPTWNPSGVGTNWATIGDEAVQDFCFYNNYIYMIGYFTSYNGTARNNIARLNLSNGTLDTGWDPGTGLNVFGSYVEYGAITVDVTGVYAGASFTQYNGTTSTGLVKINHDATINATFNVGAGFTQTGGSFRLIGDIELNGDATFLYVVGVFDTYKGVASRGIAKLDATTGTMEITPFAVGSAGCRNGTSLIVQGGVPQITTYPLFLCFGETPCDAYCCTSIDLTYYGNANSLFSSTILYANSEGTLPVNAGYYSDGINIAQVDSLGNIVAFVSSESCSCGPVLYPFDVLYDPTIPCNACCGALLITVWSTSVFWSSATILYSDAGGVTPALDGHYNYQGLLNNLSNDNGVVTSQTSCDLCFPCPSQECAAYGIRNTAGYQVFYSYTSCSQVYYSGNIEPGETIYTTCLQLSNFFITGTYSIQSTAIC